MGFALRPGLSFCQVGDMPIFLDLFKDRYFCLERETAAAFLSVVDAVDPDAVDRIVGRHPLLRPLLITRDGESDIVPCRIDPPRRQAMLDPDLPGASGALIIRSAASLLRAWISLRYRSLAANIAVLAAQKRSQQSSVAKIEREILAVGSAFMTVRAYTTTNDTCLCRSIAMASLSYSRGIPVNLVFGVSARPFSAHCWVQHQDWVLNDTLDNVRRYQPILAI